MLATHPGLPGLYLRLTGSVPPPPAVAKLLFPWPIAGNLKPADWLICSQHNRALKGEAKLWEPVHASGFCRGKEGGSRKGNMCRIAYETNE